MASVNAWKGEGIRPLSYLQITTLWLVKQAKSFNDSLFLLGDTKFSFGLVAFLGIVLAIAFFHHLWRCPSGL